MVSAQSWGSSLRGTQQAKEITAYNDAVMSLYSRTTIIRLDLYYRPEAQARQRVEQVFDHLDDLIDQHSRHRTFEHLIGYTYSVEQGDCKEGRGYTSMRPTTSMEISCAVMSGRRLRSANCGSRLPVVRAMPMAAT